MAVWLVILENVQIAVKNQYIKIKKRMPNELDFYKGALEASKKVTPNFPAQLLIAQVALETGWMNPKSLIGNNNWFGMSYVPTRHKLMVWKKTSEWFTKEELEKWKKRPQDIKILGVIQDKPGVKIDAPNQVYVSCEKPFADFPTLADGFYDVVGLITGVFYKNTKYSPCWEAYKKNKDWRAFAACYGKVYATAKDKVTGEPIYGPTITRIAESDKVRKNFKLIGYEYD